jgi:hypothetical protein
VFEEQDPPVRLADTCDFTKTRDRIGNRAEHTRRGHGIERVIAKRQPFDVGEPEYRLACGLARTTPGTRQHSVRDVDRGQADIGRVELAVASRADTDLQRVQNGSFDHSLASPSPAEEIHRGFLEVVDDRDSVIDTRDGTATITHRAVGKPAHSRSRGASPAPSSKHRPIPRETIDRLDFGGEAVQVDGNRLMPQTPTSARSTRYRRAWPGLVDLLDALPPSSLRSTLPLSV